MSPIMIFGIFMMFVIMVSIVGFLIYKQTNKKQLDVGKTCTTTNDCISGLQCSTITKKCEKITKNFGESCTVDTDCNTSKCTNNRCAYPPPQILKKVGETCTSSYDCETGYVCDDTKKKCSVPPPPKKQKDETCNTTTDCEVNLVCDDKKKCSVPKPPQEEWKFQTSVDSPICFFSQGSCPTGTESKGQSGFMMFNNVLTNNPFTVADEVTNVPGITEKTLNWQLPQVCCVKNINFTPEQDSSLFGLTSNGDEAEIKSFDSTGLLGRRAIHLRNSNSPDPFPETFNKLDSNFLGINITKDLFSKLKYNDNWLYTLPAWAHLGLNRKTACGMADKICPSLYKDMGQVGILKDSTPFGFSSTLADVTMKDGTTWKWMHPRLCCPDAAQFNKQTEIAPAIPGCSGALYALTPGQDLTAYNKSVDTYTQCKINANIAKAKNNLKKDTCTDNACKKKYLTDIELATCGNKSSKPYYNDCISNIDGIVLNYVCSDADDKLACKQAYQ